MDPLFTGCDCRRWKFREDKFALEGWELFILFYFFIFSGKTSLLWRVENVEEKELPDFPPTVLEHRAFQLDDMFIEFVDTAGQEDFEYLRTQCYDGADLFIILCTADSQHSLQNVRWVQLHKHHIGSIIKLKLNNDTFTLLPENCFHAALIWVILFPGKPGWRRCRITSHDC